MSRNRTAGAIAAATAAVALGAFAPAAPAANYAGETTQDKDFTLRTDDDGQPVRASYGWDARCKGDSALTNGATVSRFPNNANANGFKSFGKYEASIEKKFVGRFKVQIRGERVNDVRFRGSFKVKAKVLEKKSGDLVTKCNTGAVRWTADLGDQYTPSPRTLPAGDLRAR